MMTGPARKNLPAFQVVPALLPIVFRCIITYTLPVAVWFDIGATLPPSDDLKIVLATDQEATRTSLCFASLVWKRC
jgi:hypothetical protein